MEGAVEGLKIWRMKQDKEEDAGEQGRVHDRRRRDKHRPERHERGHEREGEERRQRGRRRTRDNNGGHHDDDDERGRRNRYGNSRGELRDAVTEGKPDTDPKYMATGAAGPAGTVSPRYSTQASLIKQKVLSAAPGRAGGTAHANDLPKFKIKKDLALGFGEYCVNTYKHVKAEHDAGVREKGWAEKRIAELRGKQKKKIGGQRGMDDGDRRQRGKGEHRDEREREGTGRGVRRKDKQREHASGGNKGAKDDRKERRKGQILSPMEVEGLRSPPQLTPTALEYTGEPEHTQERAVQTVGEAVTYYDSSTPSPLSTRSQYTPTSETAIEEGTSMSPAHTASANITFRPPPPNSSDSSPPSPPAHNALLDAIQATKPLRKVPSSDRRDASAAVAGDVLYGETPHSRDAEQRETAQESSGGDDDDDDDDDDEEKQRQDSGNEEKWDTNDDDGEERWSPKILIGRHLQEKFGRGGGHETPRKNDDGDDKDDQSSKGCGKDSSQGSAEPIEVFSTLAANLEQPGWSFEGLDESKS